MTHQKSEYELRQEKVRQLQEKGIQPFPAHSDRDMRVIDFVEQFETISGAQILAGRLRLIREHGKLTFAQLDDGSAVIQVVFTQDDLGDELYSFVGKMLDVGDIIEVTGTTFITKKEERSLLATSVKLLTKAVRPLPDKWHGLKDEEERYRKRYLDLLTNPKLRDVFIRKARFWNSMRTFLLDEDFVEVETPVLESTPGGADAEAFTTHHNALDIDLHLRISMGELWQKRLMVGGFEKTFEIGRQFRNEGLSPEHLQDYTQMEFYYGYADYRKGMELTQRMYRHCVEATFGTLKFSIRGFDVDLGADWPEIDYVTVVQEKHGIDVLEASLEELQKKCLEAGLDVDPADGKARLIDQLWKVCRKEIGGPAFLVNHPVEVSPLAKRRSEEPRTVERFQIIIAGSEVGNGYSELNDPIDQRARFEEQAKMREAGDSEAQMHDEEFVEALEYGMPPTCGFGVSERLFSFLMDQPIRETVLFPLLRPKNAAASGPAKDDPTLGEMDAGITRGDAKEWLYEHIKDENLRRHNLAAGFVMRKAAEHFGASSPDAWEIAGLLHDIDYETCEPEKHSLMGADMLEDRGIHEQVVRAVREHNPAHGLHPDTIMSKALMTLETITGLVTAATFVRPDKQVNSVQLKSLKKKFKDKSFAAGVPRDVISQCEELLNLPVDEALELCLVAMQENADELGL